MLGFFKRGSKEEVKHSKKVKLNVMCAGLADMEKDTPHDTQAIFYAKGAKSNKYSEIYKMDEIKNNNSPIYVENLMIEFAEPKTQIVKLEIIALGDPAIKIGMVEFDLYDIYDIKSQTYDMKNKLFGDKVMGKLTIKVEQVEVQVGYDPQQEYSYILAIFTNDYILNIQQICLLN